MLMAQSMNILVYKDWSLSTKYRLPETYTTGIGLDKSLAAGQK
jgi:hypothetical protein